MIRVKIRVMIIKDESAVICRCLASVKPFIDYWVIVDTGSMDNTEEIICEVLQTVPGELHRRVWKNFGENRTNNIRNGGGRCSKISQNCSMMPGRLAQTIEQLLGKKLLLWTSVQFV